MAYRRRQGIDGRIARIFKTYARACARMMGPRNALEGLRRWVESPAREPGRPAAPA
jgi:hypothetical protein